MDCDKPILEGMFKKDRTDSFNNDPVFVSYGTIADYNNLQTKETTKFRRNMSAFCRTLCSFKIEPVNFCIFFSYLLNSSIQTNLLMDKACRFHFQFNETICANLTAYPDRKEQVEILANKYDQYSSFSDIIIATTITLIAAWSDKFGRKPPMISATVGFILNSLGILLCVVYFSSSMFYVLLCDIPLKSLGGIGCLIIMINCHINEVTNDKTRLSKYLYNGVITNLALSLADLASGTLFKYYGYIAVPIVSLCFQLFCLGWIVLVVPETAGINAVATLKEKCVYLFNFRSMVDVIRCTFKKREQNIRTTLMLFLASMCIVEATMDNYTDISYLYVHHEYNWDLPKFKILQANTDLMQMFSTLFIASLFINRFKFSCTELGLIGILSATGKRVIISFAKYRVGIYYAGLVIGFFDGFCTTAFRGELAILVERDELGQIYGFLTVCQNIFPMIISLILSNVFIATIDSFPSIAYLVMTVFLIVPAFTFLFAMKNAVTRTKDVVPIIQEHSASENNQEEIRHQISGIKSVQFCD